MGYQMNDTEKLGLIAPIVHAARRAWRFVHAPGKPLPEWGDCTAEQRNETFDVVRYAILGGHTALSGTQENEYAATIAAECSRMLFPAKPASIAEWAATNAAPPITMNVEGADVEPSTLQPPPAHPRRGRR